MAITPLSDGGYVETTSETFLSLHVQKYDAAGNPVGARHSYYPVGGGGVYALPNGGYVVTYTWAVGGHGPSTSGMNVFDSTSTATGGSDFPQASISSVTVSTDAFAVAGFLPAFSFPESDALFAIYDLSGTALTGFVIDNQPTISVLSNGDFNVRWTDDGGAVHTFVIDPQNPPSLSRPETPIVTVLDNVGPIQGPIGTFTDDTTPTLRIAVKEVGAIEIGMGAGVWYAITAADVSRGYKDIELSLLPGVYSHNLRVRFQDADGLLSDWTGAGFTVNTVSPVFVGNDTPGQLLTGGSGNDIFYAGRNSVVMTGGSGADTFIVQQLPWNAGRITDFVLGTDRLDLSSLFATSGYSGFDPVADGYLRFQSNGQGGTRVYFDPDGPAPGNPWPFLITTLEGVSPVGLTASLLFHPSTTPSQTWMTLVADDTRDQILIGGAGADYFYTGQNSVVMTGGGGPDTFVFRYVPWNNTGHITDFALNGDKLDFSSLLSAVGYPSDPVAAGYVRFQSDGAGGTRVLFDVDGPGGNALPFLITTLDHVSPNGLTAAQIFGGIALPPPSTPPTSGQTLTGNDTRGQVLTGGSGDDTFYAGRNAVVMTGDGGDDRYVFQYLPWNGGHITDFASGSDVLDLRPLFSASGYAGTNPIGDGYLRFDSDGAGGTKVMFDPDGAQTGNRWAFTIVTLDHVQASGVHTGDWLYA